VNVNQILRGSRSQQLSFDASSHAVVSVTFFSKKESQHNTYDILFVIVYVVYNKYSVLSVARRTAGGRVVTSQSMCLCQSMMLCSRQLLVVETSQRASSSMTSVMSEVADRLHIPVMLRDVE